MKVLALSAEHRHGGCLMILSAAGGSTETKSMRAVLASADGANWCYTPEGRRGTQNFSTAKCGYEVHVRKIGDRCHHLLAMCKHSTLLRCVDDEALWQHLTATVTTPMLREWVPAIRKKLQDDERIEPLANKGAVNAALIRLGGYDEDTGTNLDSSGYMDKIVTGLVRRGLVRIPSTNKGA